MKSTNTDNIAEKVASILIDVGAIIFRPKQPFRYKSGILSPVYTDNRLLVSYPKEWNQVVDLLVNKIKQIGSADVIAGVATAGVPHAALVANKLKLPMVYARPTLKGHGLDKQVEGVIRRGQKVIVIDDLVTTGMSSLDVVEGIRKLGGKVTDQVCIFSYDLKEARNNYLKYKVKLHPLTDLKHAVEESNKKGFLKQDQIEIILNWAKDPKKWANP